MAQYLFFRKAREATDYDWVFIAGGALLGGFTASVWYPVGPVAAGAFVLATVVEVVYRAFIRPRHSA